MFPLGGLTSNWGLFSCDKVIMVIAILGRVRGVMLKFHVLLQKLDNMEEKLENYVKVVKGKFCRTYCHRLSAMRSLWVQIPQHRLLITFSPPHMKFFEKELANHAQVWKINLSVRRNSVDHCFTVTWKTKATQFWCGVWGCFTSILWTFPAFD